MGSSKPLGVWSSVTHQRERIQGRSEGVTSHGPGAAPGGRVLAGADPDLPRRVASLPGGDVPRLRRPGATGACVAAST